MSELSGELTPILETISGTLSPMGTLSGDISIIPCKLTAELKNVVDVPSYSGDVVITPGEQAQILHTAQKLVNRDITINPIPSNYGLITWDGTTLTVS